MTAAILALAVNYGVPLLFCVTFLSYLALGYWLIRPSKARDKTSTGKPEEKPHI